METASAVQWGGVAAALIILLGAPSSFLWGLVADRRGRTWAIVVGSAMSLVPELVLGFLYGRSLVLVALIAAWIGFWVVSDSAVYKAGLSEIVPADRRATYLGIQSAIGFGATIIAPLVFGAVLERANGKVDPIAAHLWGPSFLILGAGAILAPVGALILRRLPESRLMAGER